MTRLLQEQSQAIGGAIRGAGSDTDDIQTHVVAAREMKLEYDRKLEKVDADYKAAQCP